MDATASTKTATAASTAPPQKNRSYRSVITPANQPDTMTLPQMIAMTSAVTAKAPTAWRS
jgi:hypothetical protein